MRRVVFVVLMMGLFIFSGAKEVFAHEYHGKAKTMAVKPKVKVSMYLPWLNISLGPCCYRRLARITGYQRRKNHLRKIWITARREKVRNCREFSRNKIYQ